MTSIKSDEGKGNAAALTVVVLCGTEAFGAAEGRFRTLALLWEHKP